MKLKKLHKNFSTYAALVVWGVAGFMAQPTVASFLVHFFLMPLGLLAVIWLAHYEGRYDHTRSGMEDSGSARARATG